MAWCRLASHVQKTTPTSFPSGLRPITTPWGSSLTCTGHLWVQPCSSSLFDTKIKSCYHYAGPHQIAAVALHLAAKTPQPGLLTFSYRTLVWLELEPFHAPELLQDQSTTLAFITYPLAFSLSDQLTLLAPPEQLQKMKKAQAADRQEGSSCQCNSLSQSPTMACSSSAPQRHHETYFENRLLVVVAGFSLEVSVTRA